MAMPDLEIREHVTSYLAGEFSLRELEEWLVPATWDVDDEDATAALAYDVQLALAEHARGHWTEPELRGRLRRLVLTAPLGSPPVVTTSSAASTEISRWRLSQVAVAGRSREAVSV